MRTIRDTVERLHRRLDAQVDVAHRRRIAAVAAHGPVWSAPGVDRGPYPCHGSDACGALLARQRPAAPILPGIPERVELTVHPALAHVDVVFDRIFRPNRSDSASAARYPTFFCETLPEFLRPQLSTADLSAGQIMAMLAEWEARSVELARRSNGRAGVFGVNLPGQGCYLNGWLFNYGRPGPPGECLEDPVVRPKILETAVHEKWGHGYITEFTALGAEKKALGLQFLEFAGRLGHRPVDTPVWALLIDRYNVVHRVSEYLEEGWSTSVELTVMDSVLADPDRRPFTLHSILGVIKRADAAPDTRDAALTALRVIFADEQPDWEDLHTAVITIQGLTRAGHGVRALLDSSLSQAYGQPAPYILGALVLDRIADRWGRPGALAAVRIAANLSFDLKTLATPELERLVWQPRFNPDSRLIALSRLTPERPGDVRTLAQQARDQLNLAVVDDLEA